MRGSSVAGLAAGVLFSVGCASAPSVGPRFEDVTAKSGITLKYTFGDSLTTTSSSRAGRGWRSSTTTATGRWTSSS